MADETSDCPSASGMGDKTRGRAVPAASAAMLELPTLQRNALRKIFERAHFTPEEVAELGYRRLQQAEGIGAKGLSTIAAWLRVHGHSLSAPAATIPQAIPRKTRRTIEMAVRLLRTHGYDVQPAAPAVLAKGR